MSMNLIAMLVSLAMMLTGAGAAQTPEALPVAETARTLTVSNVNVVWNGEALHLAPQAHIGVSTDGTKAVYDFGVDLDGETMLPIQLVANDEGVTALTVKGGQAVTVTAEALAGLAAQLEAQMNASVAQAGGENAELMQFITEEYLPAYAGILQLALDTERREEISQKAQAVFDRVIDRGEGKPDVLETEGGKYDVTAYSYSVDAMQMATLSDAVYGEIPELNDYYSALFKLYGMLPEESGLRGLDSFTALFERFGVQMKLDVDEKRSEDGKVDDMDGVLTIDLSSMVAVPHADAEVKDALTGDDTPSEGASMMAGGAVEAGASEALDGITDTIEVDAAGAEDAEAAAADAPGAEDADAAAADAAEAPALEPIVMNMHSLKLPDYSESNVSCTYALDARHSVDASMTASENAGIQELNATATMTEDGKKTHGGKLSALLIQDESGAVSYSLSMKAIQQNRAKVDAAFYGMQNPDGTSENSVEVGLRSRKLNADLSFDLDVTADAIQDATSAVEPVCVIDDLSDAGIQKLMQDPGAIGALMQAAGSLVVDYGKLKADPGLKSLWALMRGKGLPIDVDELDEEDLDIDMDFGAAPEGDEEEYGLVIGDDGEYELVAGDGDETAFDFDEEEPVEDDGVLAFAEPRLGWLPSGWTVSATETDTAYDWVQMSIVDGDGAEAAYAIFFLDPEAETTNYIVQADGKVVDGRMMNVTDFGEGGLSVTVSEGGMYGNLMFTSEAIELDTIGQIVAGIEF